MQMEPNMMESGLMICSTDSGLKFGLMAAGTLAFTKMVGNTAKENTSGQTEVSTMGNGLKTKFTARVAMNGWMADLIMETGLKTTWMAMAFIRGQMDANTKDSIYKTASTGSASTHGLMAEFMMALGTTEDSTAKESIMLEMEKLRGEAFGSKAREKNGSEFFKFVK